MWTGRYYFKTLEKATSHIYQGDDYWFHVYSKFLHVILPKSPYFTTVKLEICVFVYAPHKTDKHFNYIWSGGAFASLHWDIRPLSPWGGRGLQPGALGHEHPHLFALGCHTKVTLSLREMVYRCIDGPSLSFSFPSFPLFPCFSLSCLQPPLIYKGQRST